MDNERISATEAATVAATVASSEPRIEIVTERGPGYSAALSCAACGGIVCSRDPDAAEGAFKAKCLTEKGFSNFSGL
jgi:hypothetical protein